MGNTIKEAGLSIPVRIVGFADIPQVGTMFTAVATKKEAEDQVAANIEADTSVTVDNVKTGLPTIPLLIKADVYGTLEAILHELEKFESDRISVRVIDAAVGDINASDVQNVSATEEAIIVGFNVKIERQAKDLAERLNVEIDTFDIIYELSEWLNTALKNRTPKKEEKVETGTVKILKHFSTQKYTHVLGGRVDAGEIKLGQKVTILRREIEIGTGVVKNLQQHKTDVQRVEEGEFGMQLETRAEITAGDHLKPFDLVIT